MISPWIFEFYDTKKMIPVDIFLAVRAAPTMFFASQAPVFLVGALFW